MDSPVTDIDASSTDASFEKSRILCLFSATHSTLSSAQTQKRDGKLNGGSVDIEAKVLSMQMMTKLIHPNDRQ